MLVYCDEVNKQDNRGLRVFHVGGSVISIAEVNGMFKMTGVEYSNHAADRFGACDKFWSYLSGIQYAYCSGGCSSVLGADSGAFYMYVFSGPEYGRWTIGACDYCWSDLSGIRYALSATGCYGGRFCGAFDLSIHDMVGYTAWDDGACFMRSQSTLLKNEKI